MRTKTTLITGASAGIGRATALELARQGHHLILVARRIEKLRSLKEEIQQMVPQAEVLIASVDVQNQNEVENFFKQYQANIQQVDCLLNNAGLAKGVDKIQNGSLEDWSLMIDTNVKALLHFTKKILPIFLAKKDGHIVNLGSVAGRWVYPGGAVYCATKSAVSMISEGLRMDLLGENIRVTNIEPGMVQTDFSLVRFGDSEKAKAVYSGVAALSAQDIAETIAWVLARPAHVNIQELVIYPTQQASVRDIDRQQGR